MYLNNITDIVAALCGIPIGVAGFYFAKWFRNRKSCKTVDEKAGKLDNTALSEQNNTLLSEIRKIQDEMYFDRKLESFEWQQLTGNQEKIDQRISEFA